jgi:DNA-binding NarL/FixJ family response regulator
MTFLEEKYDTIVTILEDEIDTQIRTVGGRPRGSRGRSKLDDHKEQLIEMLKGGRNNVQIANELGTTRQTIFTFIKRHNLSKYRP